MLGLQAPEVNLKRHLGAPPALSAADGLRGTD
jgi:hypothetical protein